MPSPFPGMDPYLEHPALWPSVHTRIIADIQAALNPLLMPKYVATIEERVFVSDEPDEDRPVRFPDVHILPGRPNGTRPTAAGLLPTAPTRVRTLTRAELRERRVEIVEAATRHVVTVVEVLSPTNKRDASRGRGSFLRKKREVLRSATHWVEIDLLRAGRPTFPRRGVPPGEYAVHSSPADVRPDGDVWSIPLREPLPVVALPLKRPDPDVPLDLQAVLAAGYDIAGLSVRIRYDTEPVPPLPPDLAAWADDLLRARGLR